MTLMGMEVMAEGNPFSKRLLILKSIGSWHGEKSILQVKPIVWYKSFLNLQSKWKKTIFLHTL